MTSKGKISLVLFIIILSLYPYIPFIEGAGYGEENESLGQFTDTFVNSTFITVLDDVIVNTTLECVELNFTSESPIYENFTEYTEVDIVANRITIQNDTFVEHFAKRNEVTYLYYDYGVNYFNDFTHEFVMESDYFEAGGLGFFWALTNELDDVKTLLDTSKTTIGIRTYRHTFQGNGLTLFETQGGSSWGDGAYGFSANTLYYFTMIKEGTNLTCAIYDDKEKTSLVDTFHLTLHADHQFRYIFACNTWDDAQDYDINNDIHKLYIGRTAGGYKTEGYFTTEDYLNYTTGQSLTLLTNASLPASTSITAEFSNDNLTWLDNEGNVGGSNILDGFYALDLRDLNYTDLFIRYNFTGPGDSTSRLFQSRLITTDGNVTTGPPAPPAKDDFSWIAIAIILSIIVGLLVWMKDGNQ